MSIIEAEYISTWDDGATEVHSTVQVDMDEMEIIEFGDRWYVGYEPMDDSELEVLDSEIVYVEDEDKEYTALPVDTYSQAEADGDLDSYDECGNGIIVYDA